MQRAPQSTERPFTLWNSIIVSLTSALDSLEIHVSHNGGSPAAAKTKSADAR
jgi:hypothetical protein